MTRYAEVDASTVPLVLRRAADVAAAEASAKLGMAAPALRWVRESTDGAYQLDGVRANGFTTEDGAIFLNTDVRRVDVETVVYHECYHRWQRATFRDGDYARMEAGAEAFTWRELGQHAAVPYYLARRQW